MIPWLKKYLIPHEGNDHRPHLLHSRNTQIVIGIVLLLELILFILPTLTVRHTNNTDLLGAVLPGVLDDLANQNRLDAKLPSLKENQILDQAAQLKANDMASKGYFSHTSPEGKTPWYWFGQAGYQYDYAGENLAVNFTDSQDVSNAWMNSPTHKANLLKQAYTEVGTAMATGIYKNQQAIFVVQLYGRPKALVAAAIKSIEPRVVTAPIPAIKATSTPKPIPALAIKENPETPVVLGASDINTSPSFISKILTSPHQTTNEIFLAIGLIVGLVLVLKILIRFKVSHQDMLTNGLLILVIVFGLYLINNYISMKDTNIKSESEQLPLAIDTNSKIN